MGSSTGRLTSLQAKQYQAALEWLRAGDIERALELAQQMVLAAPAAPDAHQLLAMCLADAGMPVQAEVEFRAALRMAPASTVVMLNYASWLRRVGRSQDALALLKKAPASEQISTLRGLLALDAQDYALARQSLERAVALRPDSVTAWHGLGNACQKLDDLTAAVQAFARVIELAPQYVPGWVNRGAALRLLGRTAEALSCFGHALKLGYHSAEFADMVNGALLDAGQVAEALEGALALVDSHSGFAPGHDTLATLLWEHGPELAPGEEPFARFRAAVLRQPENRELGLRYVRLLLSAHKTDEALVRIDALRRGDSSDPLAKWLAADALEQSGDSLHAATMYAEAGRALGGVSPDFLNAYARHAFRAGKMELAADCVQTALRIDPNNQEAWSYQGIAWRLAGDSREYWLFDYERLVAFKEVAPPPGYRSMQDFLAALGPELDALHKARREPLNQSVRNGSQTSGRLFGGANQQISAAEAALQLAVEEWLASLPEDAKHPFLSRKRRSARMTGSWSVKLWSAGRHSNHIHPEGWMSSAFYVSLPAQMEAEQGSQAGWLQFGQPLGELGLNLPPRETIRPRPGWLALFPSYLWHGTIPFTGQEPRVTIAFDMLPRD